MTRELEKTKEPYLEAFHSHFIGDQEPSWLSLLRRNSIEWFRENGFPSTSDEEWRQTSIKPILPISYAWSWKTSPSSGQGPDLRWMTSKNRLVLLNESFIPTMSQSENSFQVSSLKEAIQKNPKNVETYFGKISRFDRNAFTALNTALTSDGLWIRIPKGTFIKEPIYIIHHSQTNGEPIALFPRILIVAEEGSEASIVEIHSGEGKSISFVNSVTEIFVGPNSKITHHKIQNEKGDAFHVSALSVNQDRDSRFTSHNFDLGGSLVRNQLEVSLSAEGAECSLNGLFLTRGKQHVDNHTLIDHVKPNCTSRELYKGILKDQSRGVFDGKIVVRPEAQKTNSQQTSRNLLLSEEALIDAVPRLEINADDVKCSHGATIGSLDENSIFYLQSRGLDKEEARRLLTHGFADEMMDKVAITPVQIHLNKIVHSLLNGRKN